MRKEILTKVISNFSNLKPSLPTAISSTMAVLGKTSESLTEVAFAPIVLDGVLFAFMSIIAKGKDGRSKAQWQESKNVLREEMILESYSFLPWMLSLPLLGMQTAVALYDKNEKQKKLLKSIFLKLLIEKIFSLLFKVSFGHLMGFLSALTAPVTIATLIILGLGIVALKDTVSSGDIKEGLKEHFLKKMSLRAVPSILKIIRHLQSFAYLFFNLFI